MRPYVLNEPKTIKRKKKHNSVKCNTLCGRFQFKLFKRKVDRLIPHTNYGNLTLDMNIFHWSSINDMPHLGRELV